MGDFPGMGMMVVGWHVEMTVWASEILKMLKISERTFSSCAMQALMERPGILFVLAGLRGLTLERIFLTLSAVTCRTNLSNCE